MTRPSAVATAALTHSVPTSTPAAIRVSCSAIGQFLPVTRVLPGRGAFDALLEKIGELLLQPLRGEEAQVVRVGFDHEARHAGEVLRVRGGPVPHVARLRRG